MWRLFGAMSLFSAGMCDIRKTNSQFTKTAFTAKKGKFSWLESDQNSAVISARLTPIALGGLKSALIVCIIYLKIEASADI